MNVLDGLILIIFGWNLLRGFNKGLVEEVISLLGIVLSLFFAYRLAPIVAKRLVHGPDATALFFTGAVLYLIFYLLFKYFATYLNGLAKKSALSVVNSVLGFLFGIFRGYFIAAVVVLVVAVISPDGYLIKRSSLGGMTVPVVDFVLNHLPGKDPKLVKRWEVAKRFLQRNWDVLLGRTHQEVKELNLKELNSAVH
jgi:membrane protein required for colicin V production